MIYSMTGFGRGEYQDQQVYIKVDIKSVNSKQFDLKVKLPMEYIHREPFLRSFLQKKLIRGKVECYVTLERQDAQPYQINQQLGEQYFQAIRDLSRKLGYNPRKVNMIETIMRLPDMLKPSRHEGDEQTWRKIIQTVEQAMEQLIEFRRQEGQALEEDFIKRVSLIEGYLSQVPQYEKERIDKVKERLLSALSELKIDHDKDRFEQEMIYYLEKYDITEEKVRLQNHINYFRQTLSENNTTAGKTLTFISQEMGREINTMGSKANHFNIQQLVVRMKDELGKIKEQLANVL